MINALILEQIHENFQQVKNEYSQNGARKNYFLATCSVLDPDIDLKFTNEDAEYGGIIGIGNSHLDKYLKQFKLFRLHAVLHDATGYVKDYSGEGPGYVYAIPCPINSCFLGHVTGLLFCSYIKHFKRQLYHSLQC